MTKQNAIHRFKVNSEKAYKFLMRYGVDCLVAHDHFKRSRLRTQFRAAEKIMKRRHFHG